MTKILAVFMPAVLFAFASAAQIAPSAADGRGETISTLMFFTLSSVLLIAVVAFAYFLRKRSNREAADRMLNPKNPVNR